MNAFAAISETGNASLANEQLAAFTADPETRAVVQAVTEDRWPIAILQDGGA